MRRLWEYCDILHLLITSILLLSVSFDSDLLQSVSFYDDLLLMVIMFGVFAPCGSTKFSKNVEVFAAPIFMVKVYTAVTRLFPTYLHNVKKQAGERQNTALAPPDIFYLFQKHTQWQAKIVLTKG